MGAALCSKENRIVQESAIINKKSHSISKTKNQIAHDGTIQETDLQFDSKIQTTQHERLWQAVLKNDTIYAVNYLDFNDVTESSLYDLNGQTILHFAAGIGNVEMLMILIERTTIKPDILNSQLSTPLHIACQYKRTQVVKFLVGCGVDINVQDEHGQTPLLISCQQGYQEISLILLEASLSGQLTEPIDIELTNHQGLTPLNCAIIKESFEIVKQLVTRGSANVNTASFNGVTPLMYAGRGGLTAIVEFLIQQKASALKQDNLGSTVFHYAIEKKHISVIETLLRLGVDVYSAIEIPDNAGRTPLFEVVENLNENQIEIQSQMLEILLKNKNLGGFGSNPNVLNFNGQTPLFIATRQGQIKAVKLLIEAGANPDLNNGELQKNYQYENDQIDTVKMKCFMDAYYNCMTPLHLAVVLGFDDITRYLVKECQANVNIQSVQKKYSTLILCVLANKPEMIIELLNNSNCDPLLEDHQG